MMKQNVLEVLMFLFESHMEGDCQLPLTQKALTIELKGAGFRKETINHAFAWLAELGRIQESALNNAPRENSTRIFIPDETRKIDQDCRGFLLRLEQLGIITSSVREIIIDRLMGLDIEQVNLEHVKWVTLMVLFNQTDQQAVLACMENLMFEDLVGTTH